MGITVIISLIKKYKGLISYVIIAALIAALYFTFNWGNTQKSEKDRYNHDYKTLRDGMTYYETKDGQVFGKAGVLELKLKDLNKKEFDSLRSEFKTYGIKIKNVKTVIKDSTKTTNHFNVFTKDSILYDSVKAKFAHWEDPWTSFNYIKPDNSDSAEVMFVTLTPLTTIISREARGYKFWTGKFWSKRHLEQVITSPNPHVSIQYSKIIEFQKK